MRRIITSILFTFTTRQRKRHKTYDHRLMARHNESAREIASDDHDIYAS